MSEDENKKIEACCILWSRLQGAMIPNDHLDLYLKVIKPYFEILKELQNEAKT